MIDNAHHSINQSLEENIAEEEHLSTSQHSACSYLGSWEWFPDSLHFNLHTNFALKLQPTETANSITSLNAYISAIQTYERDDFEKTVHLCLTSNTPCSHIHHLKNNCGEIRRVQEFLTCTSGDKKSIRSTIVGLAATNSQAEKNENELIELRAISEKVSKERIQAEKNLWESQRKFKTLLSNLPGMAYRCQYDKNREMEFLSKGSFSLTGLHSWDLINNTDHSYPAMINAEDIEQTWQQIKEASQNHQPYQITYRITRTDGEQRWVQDQGQAVTDPNNHEIIALEGFIIDVTDTTRAQETQKRINDELELRVEKRTLELKLAIEQLRSEIKEKRRIEKQLIVNETSLRNAQRIANVGSWDKNILSSTHHYSDEIFRMLSLNPDNTMRNEDIWTPHIHPDDINRVINEREVSLTEHTPFSIEYKILLSNGEQRFIQERAEITSNESGEPINIATTVLDITESKEIQTELIRYREHLQELVDAQTKDIIEARDAALAGERAMSSFIANMSHEIRTPLHGILSFSNFGLKKIETADRNKLKNYFQEVHDSGETLLLLLNDLLDLSKLKAGKMMYDYQAADLVQVIQLAAKEFSAMRIEKNISLNIDIPNTLQGSFDKDKIRQVIRNVLSNSIKFSPTGSTITLSAVDNGKNYFEVMIQDEGPGVPEEELSEIFNPFIQSSKTRSKAGGTGLGLAICKEIIESGHGGDINARNNAECGATFFISIEKNSQYHRDSQ